MTDAPALLVAGVGLSLLGLELVTNALQESTSRTVRGLIKKSTRSTPACALVGIATGALVQSTSAVVTVLGSTTAAGMTTLRQAITIVAFANAGTTALVFAGAFDVHIAVLMAMGISGIAFSLSRGFHTKAMSSVALGVALVLYGSNLMGTAASDVQSAGWFATFLLTWRGSAVMAFALGCLASFLTWSTTAVALMTIAIANAGLVDGGPALAMLYGANVGSTFIRALLTRNAGAPLQVSRFQDLFKTVGTGVFLLLFVIERTLDVPGVYAALQLLPVRFPLALAIAHLALNGSTAIVAALLVGPIERFVLTTWPSHIREDLAAPIYAVPEAVADAATATDLLEKEQMRMLTATREYMTIARGANGTSRPAAAADLHRRFGHLFREIDHFCVTLVSKHIDEGTSARLGNVQGRQKVVELLEDSLHQLATALRERQRGGTLEPFLENVIETLDFLLLICGEAASTLEQDRAELLFELSGDRSEMMASVRSLYLSPDRSLSTADRALLLRLTTLFERIVWMVQRYAELLLRNIDPQSQPAVQVDPAPAEET